MVNYDQLRAELLAFLEPDETIAQFLRRTHEEHVHTGKPGGRRAPLATPAAASQASHIPSRCAPAGLAVIDHNVAVRPGQVIEVVGPTQSGKTEVLMQVRAQSCRERRGALGGWLMVLPT